MDSQQRKDVLVEIISNPDFVIILEELDALAHQLNMDVLRMSLDGTNERELLIRKARGEGASRLVDSFRRHLNHLKGKAK